MKSWNGLTQPHDLYCPTFDVLVIGSGPAGQKRRVGSRRAGGCVLTINRDGGRGAGVQINDTQQDSSVQTASTLAAFQRRSGDVYQISRDANERDKFDESD